MLGRGHGRRSVGGLRDAAGLLLVRLISVAVRLDLKLLEIHKSLLGLLGLLLLLLIVLSSKHLRSGLLDLVTETIQGLGIDILAIKLWQPPVLALVRLNRSLSHLRSFSLLLADKFGVGKALRGDLVEARHDVLQLAVDTILAKDFPAGLLDSISGLLSDGLAKLDVDAAGLRSLPMTRHVLLQVIIGRAAEALSIQTIKFKLLLLVLENGQRRKPLRVQMILTSFR